MHLEAWDHLDLLDLKVLMVILGLTVSQDEEVKTESVASLEKLAIKE